MGDDNNKTAYDIGELMRQYGNDVLRTAYAFVKNKETAEDLFQEVFIKVYRNLDKFRDESSVRTWIIRITINTAKDYLKSAYAQREIPVMEFPVEPAETQKEFEEIENEDTNACVKKAVDALPEAYREAVICVYYREMSVEEAAEALGVPAGTVKSRLSRAREMLRNRLEGRVSI